MSGSRTVRGDQKAPSNLLANSSVPGVLASVYAALYGTCIIGRTYLSCLASLIVGEGVYKGKHGVTGSGHSRTPDLGDHFGDLVTNLVTMTTNR
ncbi:hypothetical protein AVEN_107104-1 [Araneus ventricosus]|uniref:Uncharacterized protein n=1 Tax=Araneus ventricosus TaxID=182803 RepID=A0A4Y2G5V1_ARAVE|nr:hypothetical protein AVEN_107104-1 [Araneus ventricosus]